jgi:osmotically-inducible protein OsmY
MKTDIQLQQDVLSELKWEPSVNAAHIGVEVKEGIVTLAGHVDSYAEKWGAEKAAQRVSGVRALAVEMDVTLPGSSQRTDADIARSAETALHWMTYIPKESIKIMVANGWITLSGEVEWNYQRETAAERVHYLMGVKGVSNQITLKSKVSSGAIKADIEAALKRRVHVDVEKISVNVQGTNVVLTGNVHSLSERDLVRHAAWGSPGVQSVTDQLTVTY